jgi:hypothetical protein
MIDACASLVIRKRQREWPSASAPGVVAPAKKSSSHTGSLRGGLRKVLWGLLYIVGKHLRSISSLASKQADKLGTRQYSSQMPAHGPECTLRSFVSNRRRPEPTFGDYPRPAGRPAVVHWFVSDSRSGESTASHRNTIEGAPRPVG